MTLSIAGLRDAEGQLVREPLVSARRMLGVTHGGAGADGGFTRKDSGETLATAAHSSPRERGAVRARRLVHSSTISGYMLGRSVGCAGSGIYHHAPWPLLPPFVPCPSTFCEKANPEETTVPRSHRHARALRASVARRHRASCTGSIERSKPVVLRVLSAARARSCQLGSGWCVWRRAVARPTCAYHDPTSVDP